MATTATLNIARGSTYTARITGLNSAGNYYNLSGYTASGYIKYRYSETDYILNMNPTIHSSYVSGLIDVVLPAEDTATLPNSQLLYDIRVYSGFSVSTVIRGPVNVIPDVTY